MTVGQPTDAESPSDAYRIEGWLFRPGLFQLEREAERTKLEPRVAKLLMQLIESGGSPVTREELMELVWPGMVVGDEALSNAVNKLRKAFGDDRQNPRIIETIPKVGYRLIAEVGKADSEAAIQLPEKPSIAVLPFANMSGDPEQDIFCDGIVEDISTALSKVSSIIVIACYSMQKYKNSDLDIRKIGRELGVQFVLVGSIRKQASRLRITAQLIEAETSHHRWAERYDREIEDIFKIQDEITRRIVSELDAQLRLGEEARLWSSGTENFEAWQCVRLSSELLAAFKPDNMLEAKRLLRQATSLDPNYAEAWALLAAWHFREADNIEFTGDNRRLPLEESLQCINRALALDPFCSQAYATQGMVFLSLRKFDEAVESANRGVELTPNHARCLALSAFVLNKCGQPERALKNIDKAMQLSPDYPIWFLFAVAQISRSFEKYDESIAAYQEIIERDPDSVGGHVGLAMSFSEAGMMDKGKTSAYEVLRISPEFSVNRFIENIVYRDPEEVMKIKESLLSVGLPE